MICLSTTALGLVIFNDCVMKKQEGKKGFYSDWSPAQSSVLLNLNFVSITQPSKIYILNSAETKAEMGNNKKKLTIYSNVPCCLHQMVASIISLFVVVIQLDSSSLEVGGIIGTMRVKH